MTSETLHHFSQVEGARSIEPQEFDLEVLRMKSRLFAKSFGLSDQNEVYRAVIALYESAQITDDVESFQDLQYLFAEYLWVRDVSSEQIAHAIETDEATLEKEIIPYAVTKLAYADGAFFRLISDPDPSIDPQLYRALVGDHKGFGVDELLEDEFFEENALTEEENWYLGQAFINSIKTVQILSQAASFNDAYAQLHELGLSDDEVMSKLTFMKQGSGLLDSFLKANIELTADQASFIKERFYNRGQIPIIAQQMGISEELVVAVRTEAISKALQGTSIDQVLVNLRELGCTRNEISQYTGLSLAAIARKASKLAAAGLTARRAHNPNIRPGHQLGKNEERYDTIERLLNKGVSRVQIARDLDLKPVQVYVIARNLQAEGRVTLPDPSLSRIKLPNPLALKQEELDTVLTGRIANPDLTYKQLAIELGMNTQRIISAIHVLRVQGRLPAAASQIHVVEPERNTQINNEIKRLMLLGHSREYIAKETGMSIVAVKSRIVRMRRKKELPQEKSPKRRSVKAEMYVALRAITAESSYEQKQQAIAHALAARIGVNFVNNNPDVVRNLATTVQEVLKYRAYGYERIKAVLEAGDEPIVTDRAFDKDKRSIPFHLAVDTEAILKRLQAAVELNQL